MKRIASGGSFADPVTNAHVQLVDGIRKAGFDEVIWIPSGEHGLKVNRTPPYHRVAMTWLAFPREWLLNTHPTFVVDFRDVYIRNTPTITWLERLQRENPDAELVWFTGADSVVPQKRFRGKCEIEAKWHRGPKLMKKWKFLIISRKGYVDPKGLTLPPQFETLDLKLPNVSSTRIRELIAAGKRFEHLVPLAVAQYIKLHGLYEWRRP